MRTPLARIRYLGSAHSGTHDFWRQRLTGAASILLVLLAAGIIAAAAGRPYEEAAHIVGSPLSAAVFVLLFAAVAVHMRIGMQVVVEDYVHGDGLKVLALLASTFFTVAVAATGIFAALKLAFGG